MTEIIAVACLSENEAVWTLPRPARHSHLMQRLKSLNVKPIMQGFILSDGAYVDRREACLIHKENGGTPKWPPYLYSEDLW